ncbi:MAG: hypothetical protein L0Y56_20965, partial [Nitrospira sp.]|nr:hypothetical protein [Nitrospira sp.]
TYASGAVAIAGVPVIGPLHKWVAKNSMDIITLDSGWQGGNYETNPAAGFIIMTRSFDSWTFTPQWFAANLKTTEASHQFIKDGYSAWMPQDARDVYYQLGAVSNFNVGDTPGFNGDTKAALQSIKAQMLIIGNKMDLLFHRDELIFAKDNIPKAIHLEFDSPVGHAFCGGFDPEVTKVMEQEIAKFLLNLTGAIQ